MTQLFSCSPKWVRDQFSLNSRGKVALTCLWLYFTSKHKNKPWQVSSEAGGVQKQDGGRMRSPRLSHILKDWWKIRVPWFFLLLCLVSPTSALLWGIETCMCMKTQRLLQGSGIICSLTYSINTYESQLHARLHGKPGDTVWKPPAKS